MTYVTGDPLELSTSVIRAPLQLGPSIVLCVGVGVGVYMYLFV